MDLKNTKIEIVKDSIKFIKMTDEEYFSEKYKDYISNSKLGLLNPDEYGSREKFLGGFSQGYSPSLELGSAIHAKVLQPEYYEISDILKPTGKLGVFAEKVYSYRKSGLTISESIQKASIDADYYSGCLTDARLKKAISTSLPFYLQRNKVIDLEDKEVLYLSEPIRFKYDKCISGLERNSLAKHALKPPYFINEPSCYNEYAILAEIDVTLDGEVTRLKIKGKLDNVVFNHEDEIITLNDLKTTGKPINFFMGNFVKIKDENGNTTNKVWYDGSFQKFHYYRQMGMYLWMLGCYAKTQGFKYKYTANMVVVETIPEFKSAVYTVSAKQINLGIQEFKKLIIDVVKWKREK